MGMLDRRLVTAIALTGLLQGPLTPWWSDAIRCLSYAALLAEDEDMLHCGGDAGERAPRTAPGLFMWAETGSAPVGLASSVAAAPASRQFETCRGTDVLETLWLKGRESIDAGSPGGRRAHSLLGTNRTSSPGRPCRDRRVLRPATRTAGTTPWRIALDHGPAAHRRRHARRPRRRRRLMRELGGVPTAPRRRAAPA